jgi:GTP-binding protein
MNINAARFCVSAHTLDDLPKGNQPEIAFLGRSNVGKSSLINSLLKRRNLAHTSGTPGRTRAINFYLVNERFYFVDLPGYGYARVPETMRRGWGELIEGYLARRRQLALSLVIVDARHEPTPLDRQLRDWLQSYQLPFLVVLTKSDKLSSAERKRSLDLARRHFANAEVIAYSAVTHLGRDEVWRQLTSVLAGGQIS